MRMKEEKVSVLNFIMDKVLNNPEDFSAKF